MGGYELRSIDSPKEHTIFWHYWNPHAKRRLGASALLADAAAFEVEAEGFDGGTVF